MSQLQNLQLKDISQIYLGKDECCRCGCGGSYIATSFMIEPRSDVDDKLAQQRLNKAIKLEANGAKVVYESTYINVSYGANRAICIYTDELR